MSDNKRLGDFVRTTKTHLEYATDAILAQVLRTEDDGGERIFRSAERIRYTEASLKKPNGPYAILRVIDNEPELISQELEIHRTEAECVLDLIFSANPTDDVQVLGWWLADRVWSVLENYEANFNPQGMDLGDAQRPWNFSTNTKFKTTLRRAVTKLDEETSELTGTRHTVPLVFKIETYPNVPLP